MPAPGWGKEHPSQAIHLAGKADSKLRGYLTTNWRLWTQNSSWTCAGTPARWNRTTALLRTYGFEVRTQHQLSSCRHLAGARNTPIQATGTAGAHCGRLHWRSTQGMHYNRYQGIIRLQTCKASKKHMRVIWDCFTSSRRLETLPKMSSLGSLLTLHEAANTSQALKDLQAHRSIPYRTKHRHLIKAKPISCHSYCSDLVRVA